NKADSKFLFFFSSRRRHTRFSHDWSSDVCSSDLEEEVAVLAFGYRLGGPEDDDLLTPGRHLVFDTTHEHVDGERRHTGQDQCNEQNQCSPTHEVSSPLTRLSELVRRCLPSA